MNPRASTCPAVVARRSPPAGLIPVAASTGQTLPKSLFGPAQARGRRGAGEDVAADDPPDASRQAHDILDEVSGKRRDERGVAVGGAAPPRAADSLYFYRV